MADGRVNAIWVLIYRRTKSTHLPDLGCVGEHSLGSDQVRVHVLSIGGNVGIGQEGGVD